MTTTFELWDLLSRNLIDFFEGRQEAIDGYRHMWTRTKPTKSFCLNMLTQMAWISAP